MKKETDKNEKGAAAGKTSANQGKNTGKQDKSLTEKDGTKAAAGKLASERNGAGGKKKAGNGKGAGKSGASGVGKATGRKAAPCLEKATGRRGISGARKASGQRGASGARKASGQRGASGTRKALGRKGASGGMTRDARRRQIHIRIGLAGVAAFLAILVVCGSMGILPFQRGRAVNLTESVLQYEPAVSAYCEEYGIPAYSQVVLAIMQQESAGQVVDVMQCSESPFNELYPQTPGGIQDTDYSIQVGVETFAYCLEEADCSSVRDRDGLMLALQNYNFGNSYATWAQENYGGYSPENALEFSQMMQTRLGWSQYGDPEYVQHVLRYYDF